MPQSEKILMILAGLLLCLAVVAGISRNPQKQKSTTIERGEYLVTISGCHDCHTPLKMGPNGPERDMTRMLAGHPEALVMPPAPQLPPGPWMGSFSATMTAWAGPWGVSFSRNLTPDKETGLGSWKAEDFIATIRMGKRLGKGRSILPPMPIEAYQNVSDADLSAIFAYLQTIPVLRNVVPEPIAPEAPPK